MTIPEKIHELIERFDSNIDAYKSGHYNETEVRHEFIDPLFISLGWDVNNEKGYAEAYKDVIQRQIDATDQQIDNLVYELYGLTEEEIRIVEEETTK